ncbi:MAG TPA: glucose-1-phosphate thymidylyltransferase [Ktedonobacterales bacterium]|jgi:glucose-1-phosphate thymidylyltransferase|nr:glucose-1-phosphate thymidylyltransferase [Ktedonobacterales bacterium]
MKGLILSGGKGTRLRPLTYTRAKQLLPLANRPVLFYAIDALVEAGISEIGIIVGDTFAEIEETVSSATCWDQEVAFEFIHQPQPLGLAHAVITAEPFLGADPFVMFLGDNLIGDSLAPMAREFLAADNPYASQILLKRVANPSQFGVAELEADGGERPGAAVRVRRLIEKPKDPPSDLALVGVYFFDQRIHTATHAIKPSARGELEITDAIQWLIDQRQAVKATVLDSYWIDTGKMEDILDANRQVLARLEPSIDPTAHIAPDAALSGAVVVQAGARIENSVIRGPAIIGERAVIRDAFIGPFSSIYHDVQIEGSEVEYSIVLEHARIQNVQGRIDQSLIGRYAEVYTAPPRPRTHRLMLGDHSTTGLAPH